jgi:hypothetical protein
MTNEQKIAYWDEIVANREWVSLPSGGHRFHAIARWAERLQDKTKLKRFVRLSGRRRVSLWFLQNSRCIWANIMGPLTNLDYTTTVAEQENEDTAAVR